GPCIHGRGPLRRALRFPKCDSRVRTTVRGLTLSFPVFSVTRVRGRFFRLQAHAVRLVQLPARVQAAAECFRLCDDRFRAINGFMGGCSGACRLLDDMLEAETYGHGPPPWKSTDPLAPGGEKLPPS